MHPHDFRGWHSWRSWSVPGPEHPHGPGATNVTYMVRRRGPHRIFWFIAGAGVATLFLKHKAHHHGYIGDHGRDQQRYPERRFMDTAEDVADASVDSAIVALETYRQKLLEKRRDRERRLDQGPSTDRPYPS